MIYFRRRRVVTTYDRVAEDAVDRITEDGATRVTEDSPT